MGRGLGPMCLPLPLWTDQQMWLKTLPSLRLGRVAVTAKRWGQKMLHKRETEVSYPFEIIAWNLCSIRLTIMKFVKANGSMYEAEICDNRSQYVVGLIDKIKLTEEVLNNCPKISFSICKKRTKLFMKLHHHVSFKNIPQNKITADHMRRIPSSRLSDFCFCMTDYHSKNPNKDKYILKYWASWWILIDYCSLGDLGLS